MSDRNIWLGYKLERDAAVGRARNIGMCLYVMTYLTSWYALAALAAWYYDLIAVYFMVAGGLAVFWAMYFMLEVEGARHKRMLRWGEIREFAQEGFEDARSTRPWWLL